MTYSTPTISGEGCFIYSEKMYLHLSILKQLRVKGCNTTSKTLLYIPTGIISNNFVEICFDGIYCNFGNIRWVRFWCVDTCRHIRIHERHVQSSNANVLRG